MELSTRAACGPGDIPNGGTSAKVTPQQMNRFDAITFDFYNTLAYHRAGPGRGRMLMSWLAEHGFTSDPWEHQVLYDVFERHGRDYDPDATGGARLRYLERFVTTLFQRLNICASAEAVQEHATELWQLLGPSCLALFPDVQPVLARLKAAGLKLAIVSNWQCGLHPFCKELGLTRFVEHVIASAEVGSAKPDAGIFLEACRRLQVQPDRVLHVGDTLSDDVEGGLGVGMQVALVRRDSDLALPDVTILHSLDGVLPMVTPVGR